MTDHKLDAITYALLTGQGGAPHVRAHKQSTDAATAPAAVMHSTEAHDAITAVLLACTLGARQQPELRADLAGKVLHAWQTVRDALAPYRRLFCPQIPEPSRMARLRAWLRA